MGRLTDVLFSGLRSRRTRFAVTGGNSNLARRISPPELVNNEDGGIIGKVKGLLQPVGNFVGWLINSVTGGLSFSLSGLWSLLTGGLGRIINFNWNIADEQLDSQIRGLQLQLVGDLGETAGNFLGYLLCGFVPGLVVFKFNEALALRILEEVSEEAFDELLENINQISLSVMRLGGQYLFNYAFKNVRKVVKDVLKDRNSFISTTFSKIFGDKFLDAVDAWGEEGSQPWTIRSAIDEKIESISNEFVQEFVENGLDAFTDACTEAGYVVTGTIDQYIQEKRLEQSQQNTNIIEVQPNRESGESITIVASNDNVEQRINDVMVQHQMVENRDIGQFVGEPVVESLTKLKTEFELKIRFNSNKVPPIVGGQRAQVSIPDVQKSKIDWQKLKVLFGGTNGYLYGEYYCNLKCRTKHGLIFHIKFFANSENTAYELCQAALSLTDSEEVTPNYGRQKKNEGIRKGTDFYDKKNVRMYPIDFTILNRELLSNNKNLEDGRLTSSGRFNYKKYRLPLWTTEKPVDFNNILQELFKPTV